MNNQTQHNNNSQLNIESQEEQYGSALSSEGKYTWKTKDSKWNIRTRCSIYTRVMGYHRPVSQYNKWKKSEFYSRKYFNETSTNTWFIKQYT